MSSEHVSSGGYVSACGLDFLVFQAWTSASICGVLGFRLDQRCDAGCCASGFVVGLRRSCLASMSGEDYPPPPMTGRGAAFEMALRVLRRAMDVGRTFWNSREAQESCRAGHRRSTLYAARCCRK